MAKYIKLDDAIEVLKSLVLDENSEVECPNECNTMLVGGGGAVERISAMPTIEIVQCKDCKYQQKTWFKDKRKKEGGYYIYGCELDCDDYSHVCMDNEFCSEGKEKNNGRTETENV